MANVFFKKGLLANLPSSYAAGTFYVTTDERAMYLDIDDSTRIRLGDFIQVDAVANLPTEGASTSALYYCVAENILAKWNGSEWTQINKQPTAEEMKTLLGLGSMAYKSEVAEGDLSAELAKKVNDASAANHGHENKTVIDGITAEKVAAWDAAEGNAKTYADGLNTAMNTRVEALEAIDHEHANKALLDTYTQTEANLADAVAKKHAHTFNETELNKIVEGDVAKWNGVAADHLTSEDKTALENAIKEAKKAGTDANTNIETYKVTNDARVLAVEEDVAEIIDGTNGILAQAKAYSDGKLATARTEISAEIDADVKVVADELAGYKSSNDTALAGVKATAEAAAVKTEVESALAGKVDKVEGKSLISDSEIARLATLANYDDTQVKADVAQNASDIADNAAAIAGIKNGAEINDFATAEAAMSEALNDITEKVEKLIAGHDEACSVIHEELGNKITALETASATHATKDELNAVDAKFADYKTAEAQKAIDDEQDRRLGVIEGDYLKAADIANFETKENVQKVADDLAAYIESNDGELAGVKATAEAARTEEEVNAQIDTKITALNLGTTYEPIGAEDRAKAYVDGKFTDANLAQYTTEQEVKDIVDGVIAGAADSETYNSLTKLVDYIDAHGGEASEMAQAIDTLEGKVETIEGKPAYGITATQISNWDNEVGAKSLAESKTTTAEVKDQIEAYGYATTVYADGKAADAQSAAEATAAGALASARTEITAEIDADVKVVNDAFEGYKTSNNAEVAKKANAADVYAKSETFTKEEVAAAIAVAVTEAHTWGEF